MPRPLGYLAAVLASSSIFSAWMVYVAMSGSVGPTAGLAHILGVAFSESPIIIFGAGWIMLLPWWIVIKTGDRLGQSSPGYFMVAGSITSFIVVCTVSAALLRHANTTFLYRFGLVAGGRGFPLLAAGAVAGLTYWIFSGRNRKHMPPPKIA
jgi:hypothetical protein